MQIFHCEMNYEMLETTRTAPKFISPVNSFSKNVNHYANLLLSLRKAKLAIFSFSHKTLQYLTSDFVYLELIKVKFFVTHSNFSSINFNFQFLDQQ